MIGSAPPCSTRTTVGASALPITAVMAWLSRLSAYLAKAVAPGLDTRVWTSATPLTSVPAAVASRPVVHARVAVPAGVTVVVSPDGKATTPSLVSTVQSMRVPGSRVVGSGLPRAAAQSRSSGGTWSVSPEADSTIVLRCAGSPPTAKLSDPVGPPGGVTTALMFQAPITAATWLIRPTAPTATLMAATTGAVSTLTSPVSAPCTRLVRVFPSPATNPPTTLNGPDVPRNDRSRRNTSHTATTALPRKL